MAASPYINQFIQPDTLIPDPTNPQAFNRYSYVGNNPIMRNDPTGHDWEDCEGKSGYRCRIHMKKVGEAKQRFARGRFEDIFRSILSDGKAQYATTCDSSGCTWAFTWVPSDPSYYAQNDFFKDRLGDIIRPSGSLLEQTGEAAVEEGVSAAIESLFGVMASFASSVFSSMANNQALTFVLDAQSYIDDMQAGFINRGEALTLTYTYAPNTGNFGPYGTPSYPPTGDLTVGTDQDPSHLHMMLVGNSATEFAEGMRILGGGNW